jgi:hypothetical protein
MIHLGSDVRQTATVPPSLLDRIRIASPCKVSWDEMAGDDRVRFCGHCAKDVYDLSALGRIPPSTADAGPEQPSMGTIPIEPPAPPAPAPR